MPEAQNYSSKCCQTEKDKKNFIKKRKQTFLKVNNILSILANSNTSVNQGCHQILDNVIVMLEWDLPDSSCLNKLEENKSQMILI